MDAKFKYGKVVIYLSQASPISLGMHSVAAEALASFLEDIESGDKRFCVLQFDTSVGPKRFSVRTEQVLAVDCIFTEGSGERADTPVVLAPVFSEGGGPPLDS